MEMYVKMNFQDIAHVRIAYVRLSAMLENLEYGSWR